MVVQLVMRPGIKQTCDFGRFGNRTPTFRLAGGKDEIGWLQKMDRLLGADRFPNRTVFIPRGCERFYGYYPERGNYVRQTKPASIWSHRMGYKGHGSDLDRSCDPRTSTNAILYGESGNQLWTNYVRSTRSGGSSVALRSAGVSPFFRSVPVTQLN
jgi:hypothetical protein